MSVIHPVFDEFALKGCYTNIKDCPIHRSLRNFIKPGTYYITGGTNVTFDITRVNFPPDLQEKSNRLRDDKQSLLGVSYELDVPDKFLREEFIMDCVANQNSSSYGGYATKPANPDKERLDNIKKIIEQAFSEINSLENTCQDNQLLLPDNYFDKIRLNAFVRIQQLVL